MGEFMKNNAKKIFIFSIFLLFNIVFIDIINAETYNNYSDSVVSCGNNLIKNIPSLLPFVISIVYNLIQIVVPIVLVVFGTIDLLKGVAAQKEDEIKSGQKMFIKRLIVAAIIFFVFVAVKLFISFVADSNGNRIIDCAECFIKNSCDTLNNGGD